VYDLFSAGRTDGVFQFESSGMKDVLRKVQPHAFPDLAALNALYRPGPMQFIDDYSARRHGKRPITYIFPELEEILGETYGIIVYQEQVMQIAVRIAGFSLAKADTLRKAMGKKKVEIIEREGESFIRGGVANGFAEAKVRQLWEQIKPFAEYGFNKSHSVGYAFVAYITAFLKAHYPEHFMAAMLTSEANSSDKLAQYLGRCRQMGIEILPPDINASETMFTASAGAIRFGLAAIKGVGMAAVEPILSAREREGGFRSVSHCLGSLPTRAINNKVMECLVRAGCFDSFGLTRKALLDNVERLIQLAAREREQRELGQGFLFDDMPSEALEAELADLAEADEVERLGWERDVLGFYLSGHPLSRYAIQLERFADCSLEGLADHLRTGSECATVGGLVTAARAIPIKREGPNQGRVMAVFQLEDRGGSVRAVAFPDVYERARDLIVNDTPVLVTAELKGDGEHVELLVSEVAHLDTIEAARAEALKIVIDLDHADRDVLDELRELLLEHPGSLPVRFELRRRGRFRVLVEGPSALVIEPRPGLRAKLKPFLRRGWAEYTFGRTGNGNGAGRSGAGARGAGRTAGETGAVAPQAPEIPGASQGSETREAGRGDPAPRPPA
jgi:DNA polymerase-3 subunit alpha